MRTIQTVSLSEKYDYPFRIAILGDTHTNFSHPDIRSDLFNQILLQKPDLIFHTGDICISRTIAELSQIAPVYAVRGNRDILLWNKLPGMIHFTFKNIKISLLHGQGNLLSYGLTKIASFYKDFTNDERISNLPKSITQSQIVIFGHSHSAFLINQSGKCFLNPGCGYEMRKRKRIEYPSFIILNFYEDTNISINLYRRNPYWHICCNNTTSRDYLLKGDQK